jgi:DNA-binding NarL/FixJ family response regulator
VIGEDDVLMGEGIARLLVEAGYDVVAQAGDADALLRKALAYKPDVVVADVQMPPGHGDDACAPRSSCAGSGRRPACSCSPSTTRTSTRWS